MMEITYLAGLFDGEGCINIQKSDNNSGSPGYVLNIQINQIYQKTLLEITQCFGGRFHTRLRKDGKIVSIWICSGSCEKWKEKDRTEERILKRNW